MISVRIFPVINRGVTLAEDALKTRWANGLAMIFFDTPDFLVEIWEVLCYNANELKKGAA